MNPNLGYDTDYPHKDLSPLSVVIHIYKASFNIPFNFPFYFFSFSFYSNGFSISQLIINPII